MRLLALVFMLVALPLARADLLNDCTQAKKVETKIRGCTHLIEQGNFKKLPPGTQALVYYSRAFGYYERGDFDRALLDTTEALELKPDDNRFILLRGTAHYEKGLNLRGDRDAVQSLLDSALKDFSRIIEADPKNAQAYSMRGLVYLGKGNFEAAAEEQTKAIGLNPKYVDAYLRRGKTFMAQAVLKKKPEARPRAMEDFKTVLKMDPRNEDARVLLGDLRDLPR